MKKILTIAGSDSGGGAGIQADLKTITVLGEYGYSVIVALTAQNTLGVTGIHEPPLDFIELQLKTVLDDIEADAAKTGMLSSPAIVRTVAKAIRTYNVPNLVVDPVMVATSGSKLLTDDAVETIVNELFPLATVITPNLAEAGILCDFPVDTVEAMEKAAIILKNMGPRYVLIKGGHLKSEALDILYDGQEFHHFSTPLLNTRGTHGSGCTLSAAIATFLAQEFSIVEAIRKAKEFITKAIRAAEPIGAGHGPTNHYAHITSLLENKMNHQGER